MSPTCWWMLLIYAAAVISGVSSAFCPDGVTEIPAGYVQGPSATKYYRVELYDLVRDFLMAQAACAAEKAKVVEFETPTDWEDFIGVLPVVGKYVWVGLWNPDQIICTDCDGKLKWWSSDTYFHYHASFSTDFSTSETHITCARYISVYETLECRNCHAGSGNTGYVCQFDCDNVLADDKVKCPITGWIPPAGYYKLPWTSSRTFVKASTVKEVEEDAVTLCDADGDVGGSSSIAKVTTQAEYDNLLALASIYDKRNNFWTGLRKLGGDCDGTSGCVGVLTWQDGDAFAGGSFLAENQVHATDGSGEQCIFWDHRDRAFFDDRCDEVMAYTCRYECFEGCPTPVDIIDSTNDFDPSGVARVGSQVSYTCKEGYRFDATSQQTHVITCSANDDWDSTPGQCVQYQCIWSDVQLDRSSFNMTLATPPASGYMDVGETVTYNCDSSMYLPDSTTFLEVECSDVTFSLNYNDTLSCKPICIDGPPDVVDLQAHNVTVLDNGQSDFGWLPGSQAEYKCPTGYKFSSTDGDTALAECQTSGTWFFSALPGVCTQIQCVTADAYRNRSAFRLSPPTIDPIVVNLGTFITYSCNNGMYLPSYATTLDVKCLPSFEFDYQDDANIYKCRELCENDPPPALAESTSTVPGKDRLDLGWWEDTIIEYTCSSGFYFDTTGTDADQVVCQDDGEWSSGPGTCMRDGQWSDWYDTSVCSATCGVGQKDQERSCTNPTPMHGGRDCPDSPTRDVNCNIYPCPVHGEWSVWEDWSDCSLPCDGGTKTRTRLCDDPVPQHGGIYCIGPAEETTECNINACQASWSDWGSWTVCKIYGMTGSHYRSRICLNTEVGNCPGLDREYQYCLQGGGLPKEDTRFQAIHVSYHTLVEYETSKVVETLSMQPTPRVPIKVRCALKCQNRRMDEANTGGCNSFYVDLDSGTCYLGLAVLDWYYEKHLEGGSDGILFTDVGFDLNELC